VIGMLRPLKHALDRDMFSAVSLMGSGGAEGGPVTAFIIPHKPISV